MENCIKQAFEELYRDDGVLIMGRGLGIERIYAKFIQLYSRPNENLESTRKLVFCINTTGIVLF